MTAKFNLVEPATGQGCAFQKVRDLQTYYLFLVTKMNIETFKAWHDQQTKKIWY